MQELETPKRKSKKQIAKIPFPPFPPTFPSKRLLMKERLFWAFSTLAFCVITSLGIYSYTKLNKSEQKYREAKSAIKHLQYEIETAKNQGKISLPFKLTEVPLGEQSGIVLDVKTVQIRDVKAPYNPSLIPSVVEGCYDLFFRYDVLSSRSYFASFYSRIGVVQLGPRFEQEKDFKRISISSEYAEDPRAIFVGDQLYLFCNRLDTDDIRCRTMCIANLNPITYDVNYITQLDLNLQWIEKNWCPFEYIDPKGAPHLYIEYQMSPRKLFYLPDPEFNDLRHVPLDSWASYNYLPWLYKWGHIRGGTPAQRIGDEYLSFFHSNFKDENGMPWYVMGAYTFNAEAPFAITRMSEYPILFKGIYDTVITHTADPNKRVIFPSGFVIAEQNGKEVIHLACGENDCGVKIVTLDKEKLLDSMINFETLNKNDYNQRKHR